MKEIFNIYFIYIKYKIKIKQKFTVKDRNYILTTACLQIRYNAEHSTFRESSFKKKQNTSVTAVASR